MAYYSAYNLNLVFYLLGAVGNVSSPSNFGDSSVCSELSYICCYAINIPDTTSIAVQPIGHAIESRSFR